MSTRRTPFIRAIRALLLCALFVATAQRTVSAQELLTGSVTTAGADCAVATNCFGFFTDGIASFGIDLDVGTSGTFVFEVSQDATSNTTGSWRTWSEDVGDASSVTVDGSYYFSNAGFRRFRVRATAISGAASLKAARGYAPLRSTATLSGGGGDGKVLDGNAAGQADVIGTETVGTEQGVVVRCASGCEGGGGGGGAAQADNSALGDITGAGALFDATPPAITDGNVGLFRMSTDRYLYTVFPSAQAVTATDLDVQSGGTDILSTTAFNGIFGTAGSPDAQVLSVQGITSMTPFSVTFPSAQAVTQSGTWNLTNISGTVSLPTGAATAANQATQTTALQLIDNLPNTLGSTTSGQSGALGLGAVTTAAPSYTNGQSNALSLTPSGSVRVEVTNSSSGGTALADDADFTPGTTQVTPIGGLHETTVTPCTVGDSCGIGITEQRTAKVTAFTAAGVEVPVASAGTGTINSTTQRITIATDDPVNDAAVATETTIDPPGTESANAQAVQGVTGGVPIVVTSNIEEVDGSPISESNPVPVGLVFGGAFIEPTQDADDDAESQDSGPQLFAECAATPNAVDDGDAIKLQANCTTGALKVESATLAALLTSILGNSDPCRTGTKLVAHIDQTSGEQVITGTASNRTYICAVNLTTGAEQSIAIVSGTGTVCGTSTGPLFGGVSAATGWVNLTKGIAIGNGAAWIAKSDTDADNVCVLQSGSDQTSGSIVYVVAAN